MTEKKRTRKASQTSIHRSYESDASRRASLWGTSRDSQFSKCHLGGVDADADALDRGAGGTSGAGVGLAGRADEHAQGGLCS